MEKSELRTIEGRGIHPMPKIKLKLLQRPWAKLLATLFLPMALGACQVAPKTATSALEVQPLKEGSQVPAVSLKQVSGELVSVKDLVREKPAILVFYRGGWCPFCNVQLANLRKIEGELNALGYRLIGVSPDRPQKLKESVSRHELTYELMSDHDGQVAAGFGLAFKIDEATRKVYKEKGLDLEEYSGARHFTLPVPAIYMVNRQGEVTYRYFNTDYKVRLKEKELLAKAKELAQKKTKPVKSGY